MAVTPGSITVGVITANSIALSATAASGGTPPYSYQWYRSQVSGFTPGPGNAIPGATALSFTDTGLMSGTQYYYRLIATEDGPSPEEGVYTQATGTTLAAAQNPNQFAQAPYLGMVDLRFNTNTVPVIIDATQPTPLKAGAAVKMVNSVGGVPKVVGCTADNDEVLGFINFDIKTVQFTGGMPAEISMDGNCMFLIATAAIARGAKVCLETDTVGGVKAATGSTGACVVGWAYDKAVNANQLIRVMVKTPSFELDS